MIEERLPCPQCIAEGGDSKGDNAVYRQDKQEYYCYAGHGWLKDIEEGDAEEAIIKTKGDREMFSGWYKEIEHRNISRKTCEKYGYQFAKDKWGNLCQTANYFDDVGRAVMQVVRTPNKDFWEQGDKSHNCDLWGMHLFSPHEKVSITITEGQIDALSVAETFGCKYPVVSITGGSTRAKQCILKWLDWLHGFKFVTLAFDNDEAGIKAVDECKGLFEPGKLKIVHWPKEKFVHLGKEKITKDASDFLVQGKRRFIQDAIYKAIEYMPEPIKTGGELIKTLNNYQTKTWDWPWETAQRQIQPIHIPAVYTIAAKPAVGKTLFCSELMREVINRGGKVGIVALEETIQKVLLKMTSALYNIDLLKVRNRKLTDEEIEKCATVAKSLVIYDHITFGSDIRNICNNIPYMVRSCGCELIIFDNLSYSATSIASDERKGIDKAMVQLKDSTVKYEYTLLNVCHLKRDDGMGEFQPITAESIRGSQGVEMYSDYIIGLDRNKTSEDMTVRNTLSIHVLKDRMTGDDTGKVFNLFYNKKAGRLEDMGGVLS